MSRLSTFKGLFEKIPSALTSVGTKAAGAATWLTVGQGPREFARTMRGPGVSYERLRNISLAGQGLAFLSYPLLMGVQEDFREGSVGGDPRELLIEEQQRDKAFRDSLDRLKAASMQRQSFVNERLLAQRAPNLYNKILAGRPLPSGAVVIGGAPRRDLMQELANAMSAGAFSNQEDQTVGVSDLLQ